jgi:hypothetical protein
MRKKNGLYTTGQARESKVVWGLACGRRRLSGPFAGEQS